MGERKLKVVLDTNVLISAVGWSGPPEKCLDLSMNGAIINFITRPIIEELMVVIDYPKFKFEENEKEQFLEVLLANSVWVEPMENINIIKEDPDDNKFLECAVEACADYIISGDAHLLKLQQFRGIEILSPKEFLTGVYVYGNNQKEMEKMKLFIKRIVR